MITYVNSKDAKLFELAASELGEQSLDIDQYLNRLSELYAISPRFVRLPLYEDGHEDEEIFEIDANARTIAVPASFAKNGVGVVSDELAETIWFKINRYFDIKDFGKAAGVFGDQLKDGNLHILIEWEAPDGQKGASWAYAIDIDTDPDWVYFGWALTSEHLMSKAGQIKFAIRILQYNADGISYSFATQPANITVKSTLAFDLTDEELAIESVADKISNRLMGGQIAFCPVFRTDLENYIDNLTVPEVEEGEEPGPASATLEVSAEAPEGENYDQMAYIWYKKGKDDSDFIEVTDLASGAYTPALTTTSSGHYYVVVYGMKQINDNLAYTYDAEADPQVSAEKQPFWYHTSVASSKSTVCEIPAPIPLEIKEMPEEAIIIGRDNIIIGLVGRQVIQNNVVVGTPGVKVERTANAAIPAEGTEVEFLPELLSLETVLDESVDPITLTALIPNDAPEAYYRVTVTNTLNGDVADSEEPFIVRVTQPAAAPSNLRLAGIVHGSEAEAATGYQVNASDGDSLKIIHDQMAATQSDKITYKWYLMKGQVQNPEGAESSDAVDELIANAEGNTYTPAVGGNYYAQVINELNGTISETLTNVIDFGD